MISRDSVNQIVKVIQSGDDDNQRARAVSTLSVAYLKSDDPVVSKAIAEFVKDESVDRDLRLFAYLCLLDVSSRSTDQYPDMKVFRFPNDVDWDFVEQW